MCTPAGLIGVSMGEVKLQQGFIVDYRKPGPDWEFIILIIGVLILAAAIGMGIVSGVKSAEKKQAREEAFCAKVEVKYPHYRSFCKYFDCSCRTLNEDEVLQKYYYKYVNAEVDLVNITTNKKLKEAERKADDNAALLPVGVLLGLSMGSI
ncbi:hypothetical protein AAIR98_001458 [Elusimicrobium simillimum]|uniref:hypothetical protein n=1 Tax=Elusimicrobium simillimum TaxID=3143438 RepID=UPI003C6EA91A